MPSPVPRVRCSRRHFHDVELDFHIVRLGSAVRWSSRTSEEARRCSATRCRATRSCPRTRWRPSTRGWRRLVTEIGVEFMSDRALDLFRAAGQKVEDNTVFLDPDFVLEQVAKAPREFDVAARNPANTVHIGGDAMAFGAVYGPPFVREGDVRRDATMEDFRNFTKLAQSFAVLDSAGGVICEPNDTPLDSRPPRHDLRAADADRQGLHGQRGLRRQRPRHHRDELDPVRRPRRSSSRPRRRSR